MQAGEFGTFKEASFAKSLTVLKSQLRELKDWLQMDGLSWDRVNELGDYANIWFSDPEAYNQASDWKDENDVPDIRNGDQVRLKPRYADRNFNEIFTVSQCNYDRRKCWIGDDDGRGWNVRFDQIEKVTDEELDEWVDPNMKSFKDRTEWTNAVHQYWPQGRAKIFGTGKGRYSARLSNDYLVGVFAVGQGGWVQKPKENESVEEAHLNQRISTYHPETHTYIHSGNRIPNSNSVDKRDITVKGKRVDRYSHSDLVNEPTGDLEDEVYKKEISQLIHKNLRALPTRYREVLYLRYWKDMTLAQIASKMGVTVERIRQLEAKGLRLLKNQNRLGKDVEEARKPTDFATYADRKAAHKASLQKGECPHCHSPVGKDTKGSLTKYHCAKCPASWGLSNEDLEEHAYMITPSGEHKQMVDKFDQHRIKNILKNMKKIGKPRDERMHALQQHRFFKSLETNEGIEEAMDDSWQERRLELGRTVMTKEWEHQIVTDDESSSYGAVRNSIIHRIAIQHPTLVEKFGVDRVAEAVIETASFYGHSKLDEIGSSDVTAFVDSVLRQLKTNEGIEEAKGKLPRYFMVKMGEGWRNRMMKALDTLDVMPIKAGYSDGSTSWAVFLETSSNMDKNTLSKAIRQALGGYEHWLGIEEVPYDQAQDMLDENVTEGKWFRTTYGWAGGRNEKTGGTYKQPKDKNQKTAKDKAKAKDSKDVSEGDVIYTKFATKQAQKAKDKYQKQPDLADSIPLYDPNTGRAVLPKYAKGHEEKFDHFEIRPAGKTSSHIMGITKDGQVVQTATMGAPEELVAKFVDAMNRGGFSDVPITNVPIKGYNEDMEVDESDKVDTVTVDVPLLVRLLEFAREDAKTDMDLHELAERLIKYAKKFGKLTMKNYDKLVNGVIVNPFDYESEEKTEQPIKEAQSGVKLSDLVRALKKHPSLQPDSTEETRASRRAWISIVGKISAKDVEQIFQTVDKVSKMQKVDIGFGLETYFKGSNWTGKVMSADESGGDHPTIFVEVFKSGALGKLARAGIDEPETYESKDPKKKKRKADWRDTFPGGREAVKQAERPWASENDKIPDVKIRKARPRDMWGPKY